MDLTRLEKFKGLIVVFLVIFTSFLLIFKDVSASESKNILGKRAKNPWYPHEIRLVEYTGPIRHIFFHSLIIYPKKALTDKENLGGYQDYMVTKEQFEETIEQLYENNYILIRSEDIYTVNENDHIQARQVFLPPGKKPLILSLDDLSYYSYMKEGGFAQKLVLDDGKVKTAVITPEGKKILTDNGDVVPLLDKFVKKHPDFSFKGAKGIIALTGYEGILGYRTQLEGAEGDKEREKVKPIIEALKKTGWSFASHSYSHNQMYLKNTVSETELAEDLRLWEEQVRPLVGDTLIFIGPFGQVFHDQEERKKQLLDAGFRVLYGVGTMDYLRYNDDYMVMDRINIDGYRLRNNPDKLLELLGIKIAPSELDKNALGL